MAAAARRFTYVLLCWSLTLRAKHNLLSGHPNVKLFITQGGLQSIEEAIAYKVPILGIPLFGDQFHNVKRVQHLGIGVEVNFETVTKEILVNAVKKMMEKGNA